MTEKDAIIARLQQHARADGVVHPVRGTLPDQRPKFAQVFAGARLPRFEPPEMVRQGPEHHRRVHKRLPARPRYG